MEGRILSSEEKSRLFRKIVSYRPARIEVTSFVSPKWVPQFVDSESLLTGIGPELSQTQAMAFVPNLKGLERLLAYPIPWATCFVAASESFNKKNVNQTISETITELGKIVSAVHSHKRKVKIYLSTLFGCPYEGDISLAQISGVIERVAALNPDEITLSDTLGTASLASVEAILETSQKYIPKEKTGIHVHNTYGAALMAVGVALKQGFRKFDASLGGLGGCPYAKGASGNVAFEDLAYFIERSGFTHGTEWKELESAVLALPKEFQLKTRSRLAEIYTLGGRPYGIS